MDYKTYKTKLKMFQLKLLTEERTKQKNELKRAIINLRTKFESSGRVVCRPIKGKLRERNPKNCIKASCISVKPFVDSFCFTSRVFDYVKTKKK